MSNEHEKTEYGAAGWDTPPSEEDYTLEEILAEYGSSRQQKIMEEVERETAPAEPDTPKAPAPEQPSAPEPTETAPSPTPKSAMALWEERIAAAALEKCLEGSRTDWMELKNAVKDALGKYLYQKTHRKPMILPVIMDV